MNMQKKSSHFLVKVAALPGIATDYKINFA